MRTLPQLPNNDFSNKKQLIILTMIIVLMFVSLIYYINKRPQIQRLEGIPLSMEKIDRRSQSRDSMIYNLVANLQIQLNHFPSTPLSVQDLSKVSSYFNMRTDPVTGGREFHTGIDYQAKSGTIVYAAATGKVIFADWDNDYGYTIRINHQNGYITTYAHLSNMTVIKGQDVNKDDTIGNVGKTGKTTGNHLHYEIAFNDKKINPEVFTKTVIR